MLYCTLKLLKSIQDFEILGPSIWISQIQSLNKIEFENLKFEFEPKPDAQHYLIQNRLINIHSH